MMSLSKKKFIKRLILGCICQEVFWFGCNILNWFVLPDDLQIPGDFKGYFSGCIFCIVTFYDSKTFLTRK